MNKRSVLMLVLGAACACAACSSTPPSTAPVTSAVTTTTANATPPSAISTPVPIVHAHNVAGAGRPDPMVALFGPSSGGQPPKGKNVSVSTFPNIPTLPGFEGPPGSNNAAPSIWSSVHLTGIVSDGGFTAIVEAMGQSYFVKTGDKLANRFRVVAVGPDSVTLKTDKEQRHLTLGG